MSQLDPFDNMDVTSASHRVHLDLLQQFAANASYNFVGPRDWSEPFLGVMTQGGHAHGGFPKRVGDFRINCLDPRRMWMFLMGVGADDFTTAQKTFWVSDHPLTRFLEDGDFYSYFEPWQVRVFVFVAHFCRSNKSDTFISAARGRMSFKI